MKFIFAILILLTAGMAQASFFQTNCSNADQSIKTGSGHRYNGVAISVYNDDGTTRLVEFKEEEIELVVLESTELRKVETTTCEPGQSGGGAMSRNAWTHEQVVLRRADAKPFDANTAGVSEDRMSISTDFICHSAFTSRTWCP